MPNTPEDNGVAEIFNITYLDKARSMLLRCFLKKYFWIEAVMAVVYLLNRSPTVALNALMHQNYCGFDNF